MQEQLQRPLAHHERQGFIFLFTYLLVMFLFPDREAIVNPLQKQAHSPKILTKHWPVNMAVQQINTGCVWCM